MPVLSKKSKLLFINNGLRKLTEPGTAIFQLSLFYIFKMNINWTVIIITGVVLAALLIFLVYRNQQDKKKLVQKLNEDFKKSKDEEGDVEIEDTKSI